MFKGILLAAVVAMGSNAFAASYPGGCYMEFKVSIESTLFWQTGSGTGRVSCADVDGREAYNRPVTISIEGLGLGLGRFEYEGVSGNLGVIDPATIAGEYYVADANIGVGVGFGVSLDFYNQTTGLSFGGKLKAGEGVGIALNGSEWKVRLR